MALRKTVNGQTMFVVWDWMRKNSESASLATVTLRFEVVMTLNQVGSLRLNLRWTRKGGVPPAQVSVVAMPLLTSAIKEGAMGERLPNRPWSSRAPEPGIPAVK